MFKKIKFIMLILFFACSLTMLSSCDIGGLVGSITGNSNKEVTVIFMVDDEIYHSTKVKEGEKVTAPINPTKEGYTFSGWFTDYELTSKFDVNSVIKGGNLILYAKFVEQGASNQPSDVYYYVRFYVDGVIYGEQKLAENSEFRFPSDPIKYGYEFKGWLYDGNIITSTFKVTCDMVLEAQFEEVEVEDEYKEVTIAEALGLPSGTKVIVKGIVSKIKYQWNDKYMGVVITDGKDELVIYNLYTKVELEDEILVEGELSLYNETIQIKTGTAIILNNTTDNVYHTVEFKVDGVIVSSQQVLDKTIFVFPIDPVKEGYSFIGWYYNGWKVTTQLAVTSDLVIEARFEENSELLEVHDLYFIDHLDFDYKEERKFEVINNSYVLEIYVEKNTYFTIRNKENTVLYDDGDLNYYEYVNRSAGMILTQAIGNYKIVIVNDKVNIYYLGNATENEEKVIVNFYVDGRVVRIEGFGKNKLFENSYVPYKEGYEFSHWEDGNGKIYDINTILNDNVTLYAKFVNKSDEITYVVTFFVDALIYDKFECSEPNNYLILPEEPYKDGYAFIGWFNNGKEYNNYDIINGSISLDAQFQEVEVENEYDLYLFNVITQSLIEETKFTYNNDGSYSLITHLEKDYSLQIMDNEGNVKYVGFNLSEYEGVINDGPTIKVVVSGEYKIEIKDDKVNIYLIEEDHTHGLIFSLTEDGKSYAVSNYEGTSSEVIIPSKFNGLPVTQLLIHVFSDKNNVNSVYIPSSMTNIDPNAFWCTYVNMIIVDKDNPVYDSRNNCNAIIDTKTNILISGANKTTIPDDVVAIGDAAFYGRYNLEYISIPNSVTSLGMSSFFACPLKNIILSDNLINIGDYSFMYCNLLDTIILPESISFIGDCAFSFSSIKTINYLGTKDQWDEIDIEDQLSNINVTYAHEHSYVFSEIIEATCEEEGYMIYKCECGDSFKGDFVTALGHDYNEEYICKRCYDSQYTQCLEYTLNPDGDSYTLSGIGTQTDFDIKVPPKYNGLPVTGISSVGGMGSPITSIVIPNSVIQINDYAFYSAFSLKSVIISDSVNYIGDGAFSGCQSLENIELPDELSYLGYNVFENCNSLNYNEFDNGLYFGNSNNPYLVLMGVKNQSIESCLIHPQTKYIAPGAFYYCKSLTYIEIPGNVEKIWGRAFGECSSLLSVKLSDSVTTIGNNAFNDCELLTYIEIPNSVLFLGNDIFNNCISLNSVYYEGTEWDWNSIISKSEDNEELTNANVTYECDYVNCSHNWGQFEMILTPTCEGNGSYNETCETCGLKRNVIIRANGHNYEDRYCNVCGVKYVTKGLIYELSEDGSYYKVSGYNGSDTDILIPSIHEGIPVKEISAWALYMKTISSITIENGITTIDEYAFAECSYLSVINIPVSVTYIGNNAFVGIKEFALVNYEGNEQQWGEISIGDYNFINCEFRYLESENI